MNKPTIDCSNKGIDIVCEQWVVVSLASIFATEVINAVVFSQVNMVGVYR